MLYSDPFWFFCNMNISKCLSFSFYKPQALFYLSFFLFLSIENKKSWKEMSIQSYLCYCFNSVPAWDFENNVPLVTILFSLVLAQSNFFSKTKTALILVKYKAKSVSIWKFVFRLPKYDKFLGRCTKSQKTIAIALEIFSEVLFFSWKSKHSHPNRKEPSLIHRSLKLCEWEKVK